jgi:hypothetical protein
LHPTWGLNDTLAQIYQAITYAASVKRILVIDTRFSGLMVPFDMVFSFNELSSSFPKPITSLNEEILVLLEQEDVYPAILRGRLSQRYRGNHNYWSDQAFYDSEKGHSLHKSLRLDFTKNYAETVVVHEAAGGGTASFQLLPYLHLQPSLANRIISYLREKLPQNYCAVHIRHTDHKTDYVSFLSQLRGNLCSQNIFLSSDSLEVIKFAMGYLDGYRIFYSDTTFNCDQGPLHKKHQESSVELFTLCKITEDTIRDLICLGMAEKIYVTNITEGYLSGFSGLACHLNKNNKVMLQMLSGKLREIALSGSYSKEETF